VISLECSARKVTASKRGRTVAARIAATVAVILVTVLAAGCDDKYLTPDHASAAFVTLS
jgi:hypothetical protein